MVIKTAKTKPVKSGEMNGNITGPVNENQKPVEIVVFEHELKGKHIQNQENKAPFDDVSFVGFKGEQPSKLQKMAENQKPRSYFVCFQSFPCFLLSEQNSLPYTMCFPKR